MRKFLILGVILTLILSANLNVSANEVSNRDFMNEFKVGWNLGNNLDSYYGEWDANVNLNQETIWGQPKVTQELIDYVVDSGVNVIRIPVTWYKHTYLDEEGKYRIHEKWLARVKEVVDYAYKRGVYVIINTHHDDKFIYLTSETTEFNTKVVPYVESVWTDIANYFKYYDYHLIFESFNEIYEKTAGMYYTNIGSSQINELNQKFVNIVRSTGSNNTTRLLMIPTLAHGSSQSTFEGFKVPTDSAKDKLILTLHYYTDTLDQDLEQKFAFMKEQADRLGLPLVIGEYGVKTSKDKRNEIISNYTARAYNNGLRTIIWDNGSDYMIYNRKDLENSNLGAIDALTNAKSYVTDNKYTLTSFEDDFIYARPDDEGNINSDSKPEWWGTIMTKNRLPISEGSYYLTISLTNRNNSRGLAVHGIYFYDEKGDYISKHFSNYPGYTTGTFSIPTGATTFKLVIYDAKVNTKKQVFIDDLASGDLLVTYGFVSNESYGIHTPIENNVDPAEYKNEEIKQEEKPSSSNDTKKEDVKPSDSKENASTDIKKDNTVVDNKINESIKEEIKKETTTQDVEKENKVTNKENETPIGTTNIETKKNYNEEVKNESSSTNVQITETKQAKNKNKETTIKTKSSNGKTTVNKELKNKDEEVKEDSEKYYITDSLYYEPNKTIDVVCPIAVTGITILLIILCLL